MVKFYTADYILPIESNPIKNGIVGVDEHGKITHLSGVNNHNEIPNPIQKLDGVIVPGFVNSHCHLELSHLKDLLPKGSGLVSFLKQVIQSRKAEASAVEKSMLEADALMKRNGIVAVGDVSNQLQSKSVKEKSSLYYHTFVEVLCFEPEKAAEVFRQSLDICEGFSPLSSSITPHAPYSVCREILRFIKHVGMDGSNLLSIHNQESEEENKFFRYRTGDFLDFYEFLGRDISFFKGQARNSLQSIVPLLPKKQRTLFVHNTYTTIKDIYFLKRFGASATWCFCPNANLHIEGRLPKIDSFIDRGFPIVLGTDSLASNENLCILSELKAIVKAFPDIPFTELIRWATLNGATFLGIDQQYGSITVGKSPGLNLISGMKGLKLTTESSVKPII